MEPIKTTYITFEKSDLTENRLFIAIDSGNSLTKVLFLHKNDKDELFDENTKIIKLQFSIFLNENFENAIKYVKLHAFVPENSNHNVHITGVTSLNHEDKIQSILNKKTIFIDEFATVTTGIKFALEHIGIDNMLVPTIEEADYGKLENELFNKFAATITNKLKGDDALQDETTSLYPCLFHVHGSGSGCFYFDSNGIPEFYGMINPSGKTFLGLAKCLLDTNDYDEIVDLASRGDKTKIDTLIKEMFDGNINSPYGQFPPDLPLFPFGQCGDYNKGLEDLKKEDIALSLVSLHAHNIIDLCRAICIIKRIVKVHVIGNIFNSNIFQREITKNSKMLPLGIEFVFLNLGYFGVLGAMLCNEGDKYTYDRVNL